MVRFRNLLAQVQVTTGQDLLNLWNRALVPLIIFGAVFGVVVFIKGITMDRSSGEWKAEILKGISIFFAVPVINVIFNLTYGQSFHVQWN
jgi:Zn-dependent membrane protease YugP